MRILRIILTTVILALPTAALAQDSSTCKVKIRILNFDWNNPSEKSYDRMTNDQIEWWLKDGQKKFPNVCIVTRSGEADYLVSWTGTAQTYTYTYQVPKTETTRHSGTINTNSTSTGTLGSVNTNGTYSGTSTRTTYETKESEGSVWFVNSYVQRLVGDLVEVEINGEKVMGKMAEKLPAFMSKHKGQWRWSKPDKDALEKAIGFVNKQAK